MTAKLYVHLDRNGFFYRLLVKVNYDGNSCQVLLSSRESRLQEYVLSDSLTLFFRLFFCMWRHFFKISVIDSQTKNFHAFPPGCIAK